MSWRALLGILGGLLLALPLALLVGSVMQPRVPGRTVEGRRVSPVLDTEERTSRVTYRRECTDSSECEPPLGCLFDLRIGSQYCTDSRCATDEQCPEDLVCRDIATEGNGPLVRACVPVGVRREGERCLNPPSDKGEACGPGLLCGGHQGWCSRPCRKEDTTSCPEGFFCADVPTQPVCLPTCEMRGCPAGEQCIRHVDGVSACAVVYGSQCQQTPCPDGRECEVLSESHRPSVVWMECAVRCGGDEDPPCPNGLACNSVRCKPPCDPEKPDACAEGYRCKQRRPGNPWVCEADR